MAATPLDLFRVGNAINARLAFVRPRDIAFFEVDGVRWVRAGTGGISTWSRIDRGLNGYWWLLPARTDYDNSQLALINDHANHWLWSPVFDMELSRYEALLGGIDRKFVRV